MFKAPTLPLAKRKSCDNPTFDLSFERYESKDLDVLGDAGESKRKTFSKKFVFCHQYTEQFLRQCWFINKSSRSQMLYKIDVLESRCSSQESTSGGVSFFMKLQPSCLLFANLLKKRLWHSCLLMKFVKFLRRPFL